VTDTAPDLGWIVIPNWDKFQSRPDRHDPWIKDWIDQLDRDEYLSLTLAERGLIVDIRRAYSRHNGQLRSRMLPGLIQARVRINQLERLRDAGFIAFSAAKPPPIGRRSAARAREDLEVEGPPSPPRRKPKANRDGRRRTGYRMVRGTHGVSYVPDPAGTDPLPNGWSG
jgi:hypothetical protein